MTAGADGSVAEPHLVLVVEPAWGRGEGVQRWRRELAELVAQTGGRLSEVDVPAPAAPAGRQPGGPTAPGAGSGGGDGLASAARRVSRRLRAGVTRWRPPPEVPAPDARSEASTSPALPGGIPTATRRSPAGAAPAWLQDADVVLTEGVPAAAALAGAVGPGRLFCVVFPPERSAWGDPAPWAKGLRDVAGDLAGVLTDSEDARGVVERVLSPRRASVLVLPPFDRGPAPTAPHPGEDGGPDGGHGAALGDADLAPEAEQLELWHRLTRGAGQPVPAALDYPARRFLGRDASCAPQEVEAWSADPSPPEPTTAAHVTSPDDHRPATIRYLVNLAGANRATTGGRRRHVAVVGFDLKFYVELAERLARLPGNELVLDEWPAAGTRNEGVTESVVRSADTIVAEWARPNAAWLSRVKRADQQLVVRLHRFELESQFPARIQIERVDAVVYVGPAVGHRIRDELGWPEHKLVHIPNYVDLDWLDRPKHPDARFTLAMMGVVPRLKRLDLALDLLAAVRHEDPRFHLVLRSQMPWENRYAWMKREERRFYQQCFERIETDPRLRGAVRVDTFGRDVSSWLRGVGHILSLSDIESFHIALAEGMGSGAVPVVRRWPGAEEIYPARWLRESTPEAARYVLEAADEDVWRQRSQLAYDDIREQLDPDEVVRAWHDVLHGRYLQAARRFGRPEDAGMHRSA